MDRVLIAGAGVFGVTAAIELRKRGHPVMLVDPGPLPHPLAASTDISKVVRLEYGADEPYTALAERAVEGWRPGMGIDLYDYLVLPRVAGIMLATAALALYVQFLAVFGGLVLSPFLIEASFTELTDRLFNLFAPVDFYYSVVKSLLFGFVIAACCCWHGLNPPDLTQNAVPKAVTRAVTQSAMLVLLINAVFAYLVFGILFFGLVKANV